MKKFLACAVLGLTLAFNVNAFAQQRVPNGGGSTPRVSVPDNGSRYALRIECFGSRRIPPPQEGLRLDQGSDTSRGHPRLAPEMAPGGVFWQRAAGMRWRQIYNNVVGPPQERLVEATNS